MKQLIVLFTQKLQIDLTYFFKEDLFLSLLLLNDLKYFLNQTF
jgi:hypothetical protein